MNPLPPSPPLYGMSKGHNVFASLASTACLLSPLLVLGLGQVLKHAGGALQERNLVIATLVLGGVSCLLMVIGLILGILALLLMRPGGRTSIVVRSLLGLTATGLLVAMAVPNYLQVRARVQARLNTITNAQSAFKDLREQSPGPVTNRDAQARLDRVEQSLETSVQTNSTDFSLVMKAGQAYVLRMQVVMTNYQSAHEALLSARVLATSNLVNRGSIAQREAVVLRFLACNDAWKDFLSRSEDNFRAEMAARHVSDAGMASALTAFEKSATMQQRALLEELRTQDDRASEATLGVLGLLDTNWGHWRYTEGTPHLHFENRDVLGQYNDYLAVISEASVVQGATKRQLAGVTQ